MPTDDFSRTVDALIRLLRDMIEQIRVGPNHVKIVGLGIYRSLYLHCSPKATHLDPFVRPKASHLIELTHLLPAVAGRLGDRCPRQLQDLQVALDENDIPLDDLIVEAYDAVARLPATSLAATKNGDDPDAHYKSTEGKPAGESVPPPKPKRSTVRGEGRAKLIAALTKHHKYADRSCLNTDPIGNNELARLAGVSKRTASAFFVKSFNGYAKYRVVCRSPHLLAAALTALNGDFLPKDFYKAQSPDQVAAESDQDGD